MTLNSITNNVALTTSFTEEEHFEHLRKRDEIFFKKRDEERYYYTKGWSTDDCTEHFYTINQPPSDKMQCEKILEKLLNDPQMGITINCFSKMLEQMAFFYSSIWDDFQVLNLTLLEKALQRNGRYDFETVVGLFGKFVVSQKENIFQRRISIPHNYYNSSGAVIQMPMIYSTDLAAWNRCPALLTAFINNGIPIEHERDGSEDRETRSSLLYLSSFPKSKDNLFSHFSRQNTKHEWTYDCLEILLKNGCKINEESSHEKSGLNLPINMGIPLHVALRERNFRLVKQLVEANADVDLSTKKLPVLLI